MRDTIRFQPEARRRVPRLVWFLLALLVIVANSTFGFVVLREFHQADVAMEHTRQAVSEIRTVRDLVDTCGWGQHTGRNSDAAQQAAATANARLSLPSELQRLSGLVADDALQASRSTQLTALIDQDEAQLAAPVAPVQPPAPAADIDRNNAVAAIVDAMLRDEQNQLNDRAATIGGHDTVILGTILLGTIIVGAFGRAALVGIVFVRMRHSTERSRLAAEAQFEALREFEQRFRRIFDDSPIGIVLASSSDQRIEQANPAFCSMLGYEPDELMGRSIAEVTHIDDRKLLNDVDQQATRPGHFVELRYLTHSRVVTWTRTRITPLRNADGQAILLLCLVEDITRQKLAEAELRQAQKMEAIGQLTGGIAHDFNNLLGVIIGNVEFLLDVVQDDQEHANLAREILNSALSGADLTRRLLAFARRQTLQPRRIDLNAYLPNHIAMLRRLLGETIHLTTTLAADLWPTRADPSQVGDALLNLAINARDAMPHGGWLSIETANAHLGADQQGVEVAEGDYVVLAVTDTGTGMTSELLDRVVEPFFTTKAAGSGSGLGLSMIYGFAKQSGGHLAIESEPGRGTTVRLYLPRAQGMEVDTVERTRRNVDAGGI